MDAQNDLVVQIVIRAVNAARAELTASALQVESLGARVRSTGLLMDSTSGKSLAMESAIHQAANAARAASVGFGLLGAAILAIGVDQGAKLNHQLQEIQGNTGLSNKEIAQMKAGVLELGSRGPAALSDIAGGFQQAANEGYRGADAFRVVETAWKAAVATGGSVRDTTSTLTLVMKDFGIQAADAKDAMDKLMKAAADADTTLPEMVEHFSKVSITASSIHMPLSQAAAMFSELTRATHDSALAQTLWEGMVVHILNPTKQVRDEMAKLKQTTGVDLPAAFKEFANGQMSATQLMNLARQATHDNAAEVFQLFGGIRGGLGGLKLLGTGWQDYLGILKDVQHAHGMTDTGYQNMMKDFVAQGKTLSNNGKEIAITVADVVLPSLVSLEQHILPVVSDIRAWTSAHPALTAALVEGSIALGALSVATLGVESAFRLARGPLMLFNTGIDVFKWQAARASVQEFGATVGGTTVPATAAAASQQRLSAGAKDAAAGMATAIDTGIRPMIAQLIALQAQANRTSEAMLAMQTDMMTYLDPAFVATQAEIRATDELLVALDLQLQATAASGAEAAIGIEATGVAAAGAGAEVGASGLAGSLGLLPELIGPQGLVVLGLAATGVALYETYQHSSQLRDGVHALANALGTDLVGAEQLAHDTALKLGDVFSAVGTKAHESSNLIRDWGDAISATMGKASGSTPVLGGLGNAFSTVGGKAHDAASAIGGQRLAEIALFMSTGGLAGGVIVLNEVLQIEAKRHREAAEAAKEHAAQLEAVRRAQAALVSGSPGNVAHHGGTTPSDTVLRMAEDAIATLKADAKVQAAKNTIAGGHAALIDNEEITYLQNAIQKAFQTGSSKGLLAAINAIASGTALLPAGPKDPKANPLTALIAQAADLEKDGLAKHAATVNAYANATIAGANRMRDSVIASFARVREEASKALSAPGIAMPGIPGGPDLSDMRLTGPSTAMISHGTAANALAIDPAAASAVTQLSGAISGLPPQFQGMMSSVTGKFRTELESLYNKYVDSENKENTRHENALNNLRQAEAAGILAAHQRAEAGRATAEQHYLDTLSKLDATHQAAEQKNERDYETASRKFIADYTLAVAASQTKLDSLQASHNQKLADLNTNYIDKLNADALITNAKTRAARERADTLAYDKAVGLEDRHYAQAVDVVNRHVAGLQKPLDAHIAGLKTTLSTANAAADKSLKDGAAAALTARNQTIGHLQSVQNQAINGAIGVVDKYNVAVDKEDQKHQAFLKGLLEAFGTGGDKLAKAIAAASTPSAILGALNSKAATDLGNAQASLTLAIFDGKTALSGYVDTVSRAQQTQQKLTDAQNQAALIVAQSANSLAATLDALTARATTLFTDLVNLYGRGGQNLPVLPGTGPRNRPDDTLGQTQGQAGAAAAATANQQATVAAASLALATGAATDAMSTFGAVLNKVPPTMGLILHSADSAVSSLTTLSSAIDTRLNDALNTLSTSLYETGKASAADVAQAQQAQAAKARDTQANWDASFAAADLATKSQMLAQRFSGLVSAAQQQVQQQSQMASAITAVIDAQSAAIVDSINSTTTAVNDETSVISAMAAVQNAVLQGQLAGVKDQGAIDKASFDLQHATTAAARQVAQDQLRIATETFAMDRSQAAWSQIIAQDQLRIAVAKQQADAVAASHTAQIDQLKIRVARDGVKLQQDQIPLLALMATKLDQLASQIPGVNSVQAQIQQALDQIGTDSSRQLTDNGLLRDAVNQAAQDAAQWQLQIAQDQQQLAIDQASSSTDSLIQQIKIAADENKLASDQQLEQLQSIASSLSALGSQQQQDWQKLFALYIQEGGFTNTAGMSTRSQLNGYSSAMNPSR